MARHRFLSRIQTSWTLIRRVWKSPKPVLSCIIAAGTAWVLVCPLESMTWMSPAKAESSQDDEVPLAFEPLTAPAAGERQEQNQSHHSASGVAILESFEPPFRLEALQADDHITSALVDGGAERGQVLQISFANDDSIEPSSRSLVISSDALQQTDFRPYEAMRFWVRSPDSRQVRFSVCLVDQDGNRALPIPSLFIAADRQWTSIVCHLALDGVDQTAIHSLHVIQEPGWPAGRIEIDDVEMLSPVQFHIATEIELAREHLRRAVIAAGAIGAEGRIKPIVASLKVRLDEISDPHGDLARPERQSERLLELESVTTEASELARSINVAVNGLALTVFGPQPTAEWFSEGALMKSFSIIEFHQTQLGDEVFENLAPAKDLHTLTIVGERSLVTGSELKRLSTDKLRHLNLSSTRAHDDALVDLGRFPKLFELLLNDTDVTGGVLVHTHDLTALTLLRLDRTAVGDLGFDQIASLERLEDLGLGDTQITGDSLVHIADFSKLRRLDLRRTQIDDESLIHLSKLDALEFLDLQETPITGTGFAALAPLDNLVTLNLNLTRVGDSAIRDLGQLPRLSRVELSSTRVSDSGVAHLTQSAQLRYLDLYGTHITDASLEHLRNQRGIRQLFLGGTQITDEGLRHLVLLKGITELDLRGTQVTDEGLRYLAGMTNLNVLLLGDTHVTSQGLQHLENMHQLRVLDLGGTRVRDEGLKTIARLPSLMELDLSSTEVTDFGTAHLDMCEQLRIVSLAATEVGADSLRALQRLPNLRVLNLDESLVDDEAIDLLQDFPSLAELSLNHTTITDVGVEQLPDGFVTLEISHTDITDEAVRAILQNIELRSLNLAATGITDDGIQLLSALPHLQSLNLSHTDVGDLGIDQLVKMQQLNHLDLEGSLVSDLGVESLLQMDELEFLSLEGTRVTVHGSSFLKREHPALEVDHDHPWEWDQRLTFFTEAPEPAGEPVAINSSTLQDLAGLTYLHIDDRMLSLELLRALKDIASLEHLSFSGSLLSDRELAELIGLSQVTVLDLSNTRVSDDGLKHLAAFLALRELNLSGTAIRGDGLIHLQDLPQLHSLDLGNTRVDDDDIQVLARMPSLRRLRLVETRISDDAIGALTALPDLQYLDLYGTDLSDRCASALARIEGLRFCFLTNTGIGDEGVGLLASLHDLEELGLDGTRITDAALSTITQLTNLRRLRIGRTDVSVAGLTAFVPPPQLTSLELEKLPIDDTALTQLDYAVRMARLDLSGTLIGDKGLDTLAGWTSLHELDIRDTAVSDAAIARFESERPEVRLQSGQTRQPADAWSIALLVIYAVVVLSICFYGSHRLLLIVLYCRSREIRRGPPVPPPLPELPHVTVQLPMFNESRVARRVIEAACALEYPRELLQIQVLDDSTGEAVETVRKICDERQALGHDIQWIHREHREGFKGGALREGMQSARGEYIAMFDADFVPPSDFLERVLPYFGDEQIGVVQTEWSHLNRDESWLTQCQAIFLDGHFVVEQAVRSHTGRWFNFNGTAGVWRKSCIEEAGGWSHDTLTEDTDLSYRAQLAGWRFLYLPHVSCDAEIPATMTAFLGQQHRWSKGLIQSAKKLLPKILFSRAPLATRLEAWCHLTAPMMYVVMFVLTLIALPALYISTPLNRWSTLALVLGVASLCLGTLSTTVYYLLSQRVQGYRWWPTLVRLPLLMGLGIGISVVNTQAVITALIGWRSPFVRTPKFGGRADFDRASIEVRRRRLPQGWIELALAGVLFACVVLAFMRPFTLIGAPFLLLFALGYLGVGAARVIDPIRERAMMRKTRPREGQVEPAVSWRPVFAIAGAVALVAIVAMAGIGVGLNGNRRAEGPAIAESTFGVDLTRAHWQTGGDSTQDPQGAIREVLVDRDSLTLMIELDERNDQGEIFLDLTGPLLGLGSSLDSRRTVMFELEYPSRFTGEFQAFVRDDQNRAEYGSMEFIESHDQRSRAVVTISPTRWIPPMGYREEGFDADRGMSRIGLKIAAQSDRVRGDGYRGFRGPITVSHIRIEDRPLTSDDEPEIRTVDGSTTSPSEPTDADTFAANSGLVRPWPLGYAFAGPVSDRQQEVLDQTFQAIQSAGLSSARIYLGDYRTGLVFDANGLILDVEDDFADYVQRLIESANRFDVTPMICLTDNTMADGRGIEYTEFITEGEQSTRFIERVLMRFVRENRERNVVWDIFNEPENVTTISLRRVQRYVDRVLEAGRTTHPDARFTVVSRGPEDLIFWRGRGLDLYAHNVFNTRALAESIDTDFDLDAPVVVAEIDPALLTAEHLASLRNAGYASVGIWGWETDDKYNWDESEIEERIAPLLQTVK